MFMYRGQPQYADGQFGGALTLGRSPEVLWHVLPLTDLTLSDVHSVAWQQSRFRVDEVIGHVDDEPPSATVGGRMARERESTVVPRSQHN